MPYTILLLQSQLSKQMRNTCMVDGMDKIPHSYVITFFPHISFFFLKAIYSSCTQKCLYKRDFLNYKLELIFNIVNSKVNIDKIRYCLLCNVRHRPKIQIHVITTKRVKDVEKHTTHSNTWECMRVIKL